MYTRYLFKDLLQVSSILHAGLSKGILSLSTALFILAAEVFSHFGARVFRLSGLPY